MRLDYSLSGPSVKTLTQRVDLPQAVHIEGPLVLYHAQCTDGFGAAYCAWRAFGEGAQYIPVQHGRIRSLAELERLAPVRGRVVYVLDFSFESPVMQALFEHAAQVIWLDHHKSSFEDWLGPGYLTPRQQRYTFNDPYFPGMGHYIDLDNTRAGARLAWDFFCPGQPVPALIRHIEDYDLGRFAIPKTQEFILGLNTRGPWSFLQWHQLCEDLGYLETPSQAYLTLLEHGEVSSRVHAQLVASMIDSQTLIQLPGHSSTGVAVCCPALLANDVSRAFLPRADYVACWYMQSPEVIRCSLRSAGRCDVETLARAQGGGGHASSAAFRARPENFFAWLKGLD